MLRSLFAQSIVDVDLAAGVEAVINWLQDNLSVLFEVIETVTVGLVDAVEGLFLLPPPLVLIALFAAFGWWLRSWAFGLFTAAALLLVDAMGFWEATIESLALVIVAASFAVIISVPVGIAAARSTSVSATVRPLLDFMQTMPAFVYLLIAFIFFSVGVAPGVIASMIFSMPPAVRLTELGIRQVDKEVVEAAEAFGAKPGQVLRQVQIPLAMPTIMAGVNQVIMLALSMVVIAGLGGAGGLGELVVRGISRFQVGLGFESGLAVVILAIFLDRTTSAFRERSGAPAGG